MRARVAMQRSDYPLMFPQIYRPLASGGLFAGHVLRCAVSLERSGIGHVMRKCGGLSRPVAGQKNEKALALIESRATDKRVLKT